MVPDVSLLGAQHIRDRSGFSLLSNLVQKREKDTIRNERSRVINISWNNLFRNRPQINKFKSLSDKKNLRSEIRHTDRKLQNC